MEEPKVLPEDIDTLDGELDDIDPNEPVVDERTKRAETVIVNLKKQAGVKTVKELFAHVAPKPAPVVVTPPVEPKVEPAPAGVTPAQLERINLRLDGYSESEVDFIMRNGGASAKNDEFVQSAIESQRAKKKSEAATPPSSSKSPVFKKHTEADLKTMPLADLDKLVKTLPPTN